MGGSGRRTGAIFFAVGLASAACVKDNPGWHETGEAGSDGATAATTSDVTSASTTSGTSSSSSSSSSSSTTTTSSSSTEPTTTGVVSDVTSATDATSDTSTTSESTTTGDTTMNDTSTTGDPPPVCGEGATGEAMMTIKRTLNGVVQDCGDLPGRFYVPIIIEGDLLKTKACSTDPNVGCGVCNNNDLLYFNVSTPVPEGVLPTAPCFHLAAFDGVVTDAQEGICRYRQLALWHTGNPLPLTLPPKVILGHQTTTVVSTVTKLHGGELKVVANDSGAACSCVDVDDCCADNTANYTLDFLSDGKLTLGPGGEGQLGYANQKYDVYNGNSQEPGFCMPEQQLDWWMIRP